MVDGPVKVMLDFMIDLAILLILGRIMLEFTSLLSSFWRRVML